jgi:hypothetical protein
MEKTLVARWETKRKKYWYELYHDAEGYTYKQTLGGGNLGKITLAQAISAIEYRLNFDYSNYKRVF